MDTSGKVRAISKIVVVFPEPAMASTRMLWRCRAASMMASCSGDGDIIFYLFLETSCLFFILNFIFKFKIKFYCFFIKRFINIVVNFFTAFYEKVVQKSLPTGTKMETALISTTNLLSAMISTTIAGIIIAHIFWDIDI